MNPLKLGAIAALATFVMMGVDVLWKPYFTLNLTRDLTLPLWGLTGIYAGIQFWIWRTTVRGIELTDREVGRWGDALDAATPEIVEAIAAQTHAKAIAAEVERKRGIPSHVTLRYIIALGAYENAPNEAV